MSDNDWTYGDASFHVMLDDPRYFVPVPEPQQSREWVHLPYGGNARVGDGSTLQTVWQVPIEASPADYAILVNYKNAETFNTLTPPFVAETGTYSAVVTSTSGLRYRPKTGYYEGQITFEWG